MRDSGPTTRAEASLFWAAHASRVPAIASPNANFQKPRRATRRRDAAEGAAELSNQPPRRPLAGCARLRFFSQKLQRFHQRRLILNIMPRVILSHLIRPFLRFSTLLNRLLKAPECVTNSENLFQNKGGNLNVNVAV